MTRPQMILTSATGVDYYEPTTATVWIAHSNTYQRPHDPIFHRVGELQMRPPVTDGDKIRRGWDVKTDCDSTVSNAAWLDGPGRYETSDYRSSDYGLRIPIRWAVQFARPCRRCWR